MSELKKQNLELNTEGSRLSEELLMSRMVFEAYCRLHAFYYLKQLQKATDLQVRTELYPALANRPGEPGYDAEHPEDNPPFPEEDSDDFDFDTYQCLLDFLRDNTVTFSRDHIDYFRENGESTPISSILNSNWRTPWKRGNGEKFYNSKLKSVYGAFKSFIKNNISNNRNARSNDEELAERRGLRYSEKDDFQHQTLLMRDMVLTCTAHNFSDLMSSHKTSVVSINNKSLHTYRTKFPGTLFYKWYAFKTDKRPDRERYTDEFYISNSCTTEELYRYVSEEKLTDLTPEKIRVLKASVEISELDAEYYSLRQGAPGQEEPGTSRRRMEKPASSSGDGFSHEYVLDEPTYRPKKSRWYRLRSWVKEQFRYTPELESSYLSYARSNSLKPQQLRQKYYRPPSSTNMGEGDKATSLTDIAKALKSGNYKIMESKNVWDITTSKRNLRPRVLD